MLRANPKLHIKKAEIMLRRFYNKEKYTDSEMKKLIDIALISWNRLKDCGNVDELSVFRFDYHPDSGYYIFDNSLLIFGNLYYDKSNHHYEFENNVLMIDNTTSVGQSIINLFIKKFDREKENYEN